MDIIGFSMPADGCRWPYSWAKTILITDSGQVGPQLYQVGEEDHTGGTLEKQSPYVSAMLPFFSGACDDEVAFELLN